MGGEAERTRASAAPAPRHGRLLLLFLLLLFLVFAVGLALFWLRSPRYSLWVNGERVATVQEDAALRAALAEWVSRAMGQQVTLEHGEQSWTYSLAELGLLLPVGAAEEELERAVSRRPGWRNLLEARLELPAAWDEIRLEAALAPVRDAVERPPVSAQLQVSGAGVTILPSAEGVRIDSEALRRALAANETGRIALPLAAVAPELSTGALEQRGIRRLIAEWSTEYDPKIPRAENVERAAHSFDGLILKPGEILSYNGVVGPIEAANGWREAWVIVGGELVPGIGGGVCQVSTTLYGAALRAGLEILERHPHQLAVSYIPPSEDAAVAQGLQDLKIRNNTGGHLLIKTESGGGRVTFRLYGDLPADLEVRIESEVTGSLPFPTRLVDDPALPPGQLLRVRDGIPGITSQAYRVVLQGGRQIRRELLSKDRYEPTAELIRVGPASPPQAPAQQPPAGPGAGR